MGKPDLKPGNGGNAEKSSIAGTATLAERLLELGIEDALVMDPRDIWDSCAIGVLERYGMEPIVLYDKELVIQQLIEDGCNSYEGALEYYEHSQLGAWLGDRTPGFLVRLSKL